MSSDLQALLARSGGDVAAAANAFFDGSIPQPGSSGASSGGNAAAVAASEDVLATLFKTLEDTGKKLAERNQQLDMTTRLCDALTRRLHDLERNLAEADAGAGASTKFVSLNAYKEDELEECFERNAEGMLKNMAIHELALAATFYDCTVDTLARVDVEAANSRSLTLGGRTDFAKLEIGRAHV